MKLSIHQMAVLTAIINEYVPSSYALRKERIVSAAFDNEGTLINLHWEGGPWMQRSSAADQGDRRWPVYLLHMSSSHTIVLTGSGPAAE